MPPSLPLCCRPQEGKGSLCSSPCLQLLEQRPVGRRHRLPVLGVIKLFSKSRLAGMQGCLFWPTRSLISPCPSPSAPPTTVPVHLTGPHPAAQVPASFWSLCLWSYAATRCPHSTSDRSAWGHRPRTLPPRGSPGSTSSRVQAHLPLACFPLASQSLPLSRTPALTTCLQTSAPSHELVPALGNPFPHLPTWGTPTFS